MRTRRCSNSWESLLRTRPHDSLATPSENPSGDWIWTSVSTYFVQPGNVSLTRNLPSTWWSCPMENRRRHHTLCPRCHV